jgi:hypothetical protein
LSAPSSRTQTHAFLSQILSFLFVWKISSMDQEFLRAGVALLLWKFWLVSPGISTRVYTPYKQHHPVRFICDFLLQVFVSRMQSADLLSLYLQHNFLNDWGALGNSSLPPSVAVCLQYNCLTPPLQSLCPKNVAGAAARPGYQCLKVSGTPGWDETWAILKHHHCHHLCWYIGKKLGLGKTE